MLSCVERYLREYVRRLLNGFHFPDGIDIVEEFVLDQLVCQLDEEGTLVVLIGEILCGKLSKLEPQTIVQECLPTTARFIIDEIVDRVNDVLTFIDWHVF